MSCIATVELLAKPRILSPCRSQLLPRRLYSKCVITASFSQKPGSVHATAGPKKGHELAVYILISSSFTPRVRAVLIHTGLPVHESIQTIHTSPDVLVSWQAHTRAHTGHAFLALPFSVLFSSCRYTRCCCRGAACID